MIRLIKAEEQRRKALIKNAELEHDLKKTNADLEFVAIMTDVEIPEETVSDEAKDTEEKR